MNNYKLKLIGLLLLTILVGVGCLLSGPNSKLFTPIAMGIIVLLIVYELRAKRDGVEVERILAEMAERILLVHNDVIIWTSHLHSELFGKACLHKRVEDVFPNIKVEFETTQHFAIRLRDELRHYSIKKVKKNEKENYLILKNETELHNNKQRIIENEANVEAIHKLTMSGHYEWEKWTDTNKWSESFYKVYGVTKDRFSGYFTSVFVSLIHPDDRKKMGEYLENIKKHEVEKDVVYRVIRPNGEVRFIKEANQFFRVDGKVVKMIGVCQDITDQKRVETEFLQAKEESERANKAKTNFLMNMSHELRTPLNVILGNIEIVESSLKENRQPDLLHHMRLMKKSGELLLANVGSILDLSKIELGKINLIPQHFILSEMIDSTLDIFRQKIKEKDLDLIYVLDESLKGVSYYGDQDKVQQIVVNLLSNAIKFTFKGSITLEVSSDFPWIFFSVKDTGMGIPAEKQEHIFEEFFQVDYSISRRFGGSGIGLHLSRQMARLMGGDITFTSTHEGSAFTAQVVLSRTEETNEGKGTVEEEQITLPQRTKNKPPQVLVVDDAEDNRSLMSTILKNMGYVVEMAETGQIAIDKIKINNFDLVLMDIQMPDLDGYETTKIIRKYELENRLEANYIVACTAHCFKEDVERVFAAGCNDHLPKPVKKAFLKEILMRYGIGIN